MTIWDALFQGIVQGLTEFLPVSSSGHLSLVQYFTGNSGETGAMFSILLHLGTLIAVFIAFRKIIFDLILEAFAMLGDIFRGKFSFRKMNPKQDDLAVCPVRGSSAVLYPCEGLCKHGFLRQQHSGGGSLLHCYRLSAASCR